MSKSFSFLLVISLAAYIDNVLKLIYHNPRPLWNHYSGIYICDGGYGNPSGHAFSSSSVYLSFWHLTSHNQFFSNRYYLKVIYLIFTIAFVLLIMTTRFYLLVHSLNQLLYGFTLGTALYIFIFHCLELQNYNYKQFFDQFNFTVSHLYYGILYILFFGILMLAYFLQDFDNSQYEPQFEQYCSKVNYFRRFQYDGLTNALFIFALYGAHIGIMILLRLIRYYHDNEEEWFIFHEFSDTSIIKSILRLLLFLLIAVIPGILLIVVSNNTTILNLCIFKISLPYFLIFCFIMVGIFLAYKLKLTKAKGDLSLVALKI